MSAENAKRGLWFLCFPHFAADIFPDQFSVLVSYPVTPKKSREELHVFLIGDAATSESYREAQEATLRMWDDLNREDLRMLELLQHGRRSPVYDGGRLSPHWESPTYDFGRRVAERLLSWPNSFGPWLCTTRSTVLAPFRFDIENIQLLNE